MNFDTERHDGSGNTVFTAKNKGLNGSFKYVGFLPIQGEIVKDFVLVDKDDHERILINKATKQRRILSGRLINDGDFKSLQKHLKPCSFDEGDEVRSWLRVAPGAEIFADDDGTKYGTGPISKYKGYSFLNDNSSRPAVELVNDFFAYWYLKHGGDRIVTEKHVSVNDHL